MTKIEKVMRYDLDPGTYERLPMNTSANLTTWPIMPWGGQGYSNNLYTWNMRDNDQTA